MDKPLSWISTEDIIGFLHESGGFTLTKGAGSHVFLRNKAGTSIVLPRQSNIGLGMLRKVFKVATESGSVSKKEFMNFIKSKSPLAAEFLTPTIESDSGVHKSIKDEILRNRLRRLKSAPLDTIIREAGVVLEDRIRQVANELDQSLHGVALVDAVMMPGKAKIEFSSHPGEQDGARMLYRGAMQFIRNPAMHKMIDYQENEAELFLQVIDSLLQLLSKSGHNLDLK